MSIGTVGRGTETLTVVRPDTGERIELHELEDLDLGALLSVAYDMQRDWRLIERAVRSEIERRARERGYDDGKRRVYARWERTQRVVWEQVQEVSE